MKKTPLHELHLKLGARMGEFGGWDMPIQYAGILAEHTQTRSRSSIFDICHMGEFELAGAGAAADLDRLLTCDIASLAVGQVRYGFMLNDEGGTMDDLTVYRMADDRFMLVVNAGTTEKDAGWIRGHVSDSTTFSDLSAELAKLDVQGPSSPRVLADVMGGVPDLGYFRLETLGNGWIISRTGYTGEWGYEVYLPAADAADLWERIVAHAECAPGGLGARDTLRLEMGYSLYGHELSEERSPVETSRGMFIGKKKDFIGRARVCADLEAPGALLVGLKLASKRAAREHDKVFSGAAEVGAVSSGSVAPSLGVAIALAFVAPECAELGGSLDVEIRGKRFPAKVVGLPFYRDGTARGL